MMALDLVRLITNMIIGTQGKNFNKIIIEI